MRVRNIRSLDGPNVFTYNPAVVLELDLEELAGVERSQLDGLPPWSAVSPFAALTTAFSCSWERDGTAACCRAQSPTQPAPWLSTSSRTSS